jgi:hypothetical protein
MAYIYPSKKKNLIKKKEKILVKRNFLQSLNGKLILIYTFI